MTILPTAILVSLIVILTRIMPFVFAKKLQKAKLLEVVGKELPAYIMMILVVYQVGLSSFFKAPYAMPYLISLSVLTLVHIWQRQVLLSMLVSVVFYLVVSPYF